MKFSELDISRLNPSDIYDLIMSGVIDFARETPTDKTNPDIIVVLGCSPIPLKARIVKMLNLYKKGFGKYVLLSGGTGWHKLFKQEKRKFSSPEAQAEYLKRLAKKYKEMKWALHHTIPDDIHPDPDRFKSNKGKYRYMRRKLKQNLEKPEAQIGYRIMKACHEIAQIDEDKIFFEPDSRTTLENLQYSKKLLDELQAKRKVSPIKRIMIITSSFHCRRAVFSFKKFFPGVEVIACPATRDIENQGLSFTKESLMQSEYYSEQFKNELNAVINYTRNGSIQDMDIEEVLTPEKAQQIESKMQQEQSK